MNSDILTSVNLREVTVCWFFFGSLWPFSLESAKGTQRLMQILLKFLLSS